MCVVFGARWAEGTVRTMAWRPIRFDGDKAVEREVETSDGQEVSLERMTGKMSQECHARDSEKSQTASSIESPLSESRSIRDEFMSPMTVKAMMPSVTELSPLPF